MPWLELCSAPLEQESFGAATAVSKGDASDINAFVTAWEERDPNGLRHIPCWDMVHILLALDGSCGINKLAVDTASTHGHPSQLESPSARTARRGDPLPTHRRRLVSGSHRVVDVIRALTELNIPVYECPAYSVPSFQSSEVGESERDSNVRRPPRREHVPGPSPSHWQAAPAHDHPSHRAHYPSSRSAAAAVTAQLGVVGINAAALFQAEAGGVGATKTVAVRGAGPGMPVFDSDSPTGTSSPTSVGPVSPLEVRVVAASTGSDSEAQVALAHHRDGPTSSASTIADSDTMIRHCLPQQPLSQVLLLLWPAS